MTRCYAIYDLATGAIVRIVDLKFVGAPDPAEIAAKAARQCREGQGYAVWPDSFDGDDTTHRIENGEPVPI